MQQNMERKSGLRNHVNETNVTSTAIMTDRSIITVIELDSDSSSDDDEVQFVKTVKASGESSTPGTTATPNSVSDIDFTTCMQSSPYDPKGLVGRETASSRGSDWGRHGEA